MYMPQDLREELVGSVSKRVGTVQDTMWPQRPCWGVEILRSGRRQAPVYLSFAALPWNWQGGQRFPCAWGDLIPPGSTLKPSEAGFPISQCPPLSALFSPLMGTPAHPQGPLVSLPRPPKITQHSLKGHNSRLALDPKFNHSSVLRAHFHPGAETSRDLDSAQGPRDRGHGA